MRAPDTSQTAKRPLTVLMTAYNAEKTIASAIDSMLKQTFTDFNLLVVNDGSTDRTGDIVQQIASADDRVLYWPMEHVGLCTAVNAGLAGIQSRYVARMDADDLSHPARLAKQLDFIQRQPGVKVVGAHAHTIANNGRHITRIGSGPATVEEYVEFRKKRKPFFLLNSSVLAERSALVDYGGYRWDDFPADDVGLYTRIAQDHPVLTMPDYLVDYRLTPGGITSSHQWRMIVQFAKFDYNLQNEQPVDFDSFVRRLAGRPWSRLRLRWGSLHKSTVRYGAYHFFNGRPTKGLLFLLCGAAMEPHRGIQKLMRAQL